MTSRTDQLLAHFNNSQPLLTQALAQVRENITVMEYGSDYVFTGPNRHRFRELLADEAALSGALRRLAVGQVPDQMEVTLV